MNPDCCSRASTRRFTPSPAICCSLESGSIVAQPFDLQRLELSGDVVPLVSSDYWPTPVHGGDAFSELVRNWPSFSTSDTGRLTYAIAEHPEPQFRWMAHRGSAAVVGEPGPYMGLI